MVILEVETPVVVVVEAHNEKINSELEKNLTITDAHPQT